MSLWDALKGGYNWVTGNDQSTDPDQSAADALGISPNEYRRRQQEQQQQHNNLADLRQQANNPNLQQTQDDLKKKQQDLANQGGAQAATVGPITEINGAQIDRSDIGGPSSFRGNLGDLISQLEAQSQGQGPSIAQQQLRAATDRNVRQAMGLAATQRGVGAGTALRNAQQAQGEANQEAAGQSGLLRLQEQMAARNALGQTLGTGLNYDTGLRGQNIGLATNQAELNQQAAMANQGALNQGTFMNAANQQQTNLANQQQQLTIDKLIQEYEQMGMSADEAQRRAMLDAAGLNQSYINAQYAGSQQRQGQEQGEGIHPSDIFKVAVPAAAGVVAGGAGALSHSDEKLKKNISSDKSEAEDFLNSLESNLSTKPTENVMPVSSLKSYEDTSMPVGLPNPMEYVNAIRYGGNMVRADLASNPMLVTTGGSDVGIGRSSDIKDAVAGIQNPMNNNMDSGIIMSDKKTKKDVEKAVLTDFLDALQPKTYEYRDPKELGASPGRHLGFIAQELEKSGPIGESMVIEGPEGKMVDYGQGLGAMMAAIALHQDKLNELETLIRKKK